MTKLTEAQRVSAGITTATASPASHNRSPHNTRRNIDMENIAVPGQRLVLA